MEEKDPSSTASNNPVTDFLEGNLTILLITQNNIGGAFPKGSN